MHNPREAQRDFLYLRNVILIAFILMGTFTVANNAGQGFPFAILSLDGEKATGTITDTVWARKVGLRSVSYSYRDHQGAIRTAKKQFSGHVILAFFRHQSIEVRYSRHFPNVSTITPLWHHMRFEFFFMVSGLVVVLVAGGLSFFAVLSTAKHKLQDRRY